MTNLHHSENLDDRNNRSLRTLIRAITFSSGRRFSLILVCCNYQRLQAKILQRLREESPVEIREFILPPSAQTLYSAIQTEVGDEELGALMVLGLENVRDLDRLLLATNQVRDEFPKSFPFPLVLWVTDEVMKRLIRVSPDFHNWAATPISFFFATDELINIVEELVADEWVVANRQSRQELDYAIRDLEERGEVLNSDLQANLQWFLGWDDYKQGKIEEAIAHYQQSLSFYQNLPHSPHPERQGIVLCYLGLSSRRQAEFNRAENQRYFQEARGYFQGGISLFEEIQRQDLVAGWIGELGEVLQLLQEWAELQELAQKALTLYQSYGNSVQTGQAYGFLARVALAGGKFREAKRWANQALIITSRENLAQSLYLLLLAKAQREMKQYQEAINSLERARNEINPYDRPLLYIDILKELHSLYFDQKQYLKAFEIKQAQGLIESKFGLRAFIGASRLQPLPGESQDTVAAEIAVSSRQEDVKRLIGRIARDDCRLTVIHGQSGVGKSSLVNGGLIPALREKMVKTFDVLPISLRVYTNWLEDLANLLGISLPTPSSSSSAILEQLRQNERQNLLTVLIFDQFEEFFFVYTDGTTRRPFFQFLSDCLNIPSVRVILSLREDYLHYLLECERLAQIDIIITDILSKNNRYELGDFAPEDAAAIIRRLTERSQFHLESELIEQLVQDLAQDSGKVRPIELQIVGAQLQAENIITLAQYRAGGTKDDLVRRYVDAVITDCGRENRQLAELILYGLTNENNTRPLKTRAELATELRTLVTDLAIEVDKWDLVLQIFVGSGLVFELPENPANRYQLVHDYLVAFIRQQQGFGIVAELAAEREKRRETEKQLQFVERKTKQTIRRGLIFLAGISVLTIGVGFLGFKAGVGLRKAQTVTELERTSVAAFKLFKYQSIEALLSAMDGGQKLKELVKDNRPLEKYPATSPLLALQTILANIWERNQLQHQGYVTAVAFSPDGKEILTGSDDNNARLWDRRGNLITKLTGHQGEVNAVAFSPDGKEILTGSDDNNARLWDRRGNLITKLTGHQGEVNAVAFSPDGKEILTGSDDNNARLWDRRGNLTTKLTGHQGEVNAVAFSPDGKEILTGSDDKTAHLWDRRGNLITKLTGHQGEVNAVAFSPDGKEILTGSDDKTTHLWDRRGNLITKLTGHQSFVTAVAFSPDGKEILTGSRDKTAHLWDRRGNLITKLTGHQSFVTAVTFSPDGKEILTGSDDNTARLWDNRGNPIKELTGHQDFVFAVAFSPDGKQILTGSGDKTVRLWDNQGNPIKELTGHQDFVFAVAFSPDGKQILTGSYDKTARLWDNQGNLIKVLTGHHYSVNAVAFSLDGKQILTGSEDKTARLWDNQGNPIKELTGHQDFVNAVAFSPDGKEILTGSYDKTARLWDNQGNLIKVLTGHQRYVFAVAFSPDGKQILTGSWDNTARLWDNQGNLIKVLTRHQDSVNAVAFSPDGKQILTASRDNTIRLWDLRGQQIAEIEGDYGAISPDWRTIALRNDNTVVLKQVDRNLDELLAHGCDWLKDYFASHPDELQKLPVCQK